MPERKIWLGGLAPYRPGLCPLARMQLLKTSAFEPATPEIAASRSHACASRLKVFVLSVPAFGIVPVPLVVLLPAGAGG